MKSEVEREDCHRMALQGEEEDPLLESEREDCHRKELQGEEEEQTLSLSLALSPSLPSLLTPSYYLHYQ